MKTFIVRYAHLSEIYVDTNDTVLNTAGNGRGNRIGKMGGTPNNDAENPVYPKHLHIDCRQITASDTDGGRLWRLSETPQMWGINPDSKKQLDFFIDVHLFNYTPHITTQYLCADYVRDYGVPHPAYDVVPLDRFSSTKHFVIYWNRSMSGKVVRTGYDKNKGGGGYGKYVLILFSVED